MFSFAQPDSDTVQQVRTIPLAYLFYFCAFCHVSNEFLISFNQIIAVH